jgi:hypothetical protein
MLKGSWKPAMVACLIVGLVGTSTAQASDAGLRKVVKRQEKRVAPMAKKFGAADKALAQAPDTSAASAAGTALRKGLRGFKNAVVPIKTQTPTAALAKKKLLKALREFDLGLVQYQTLLDKVNAGATKDSLKQSFVTLNKRIAAAAKNETAALRLLSSQA